MKMREEITFDLSKKLEYQKDGNQKTQKLHLRAPTTKHERFVCEIKQAYSRATLMSLKLMGGAQNTNNVDDGSSEVREAEDSGPDLQAFWMVMEAGCEDLFKFKSTFYKMLCEGLCYIDGDTGKANMTTSLIDDMSLSDKDTMIGLYFENFI